MILKKITPYSPFMALNTYVRIFCALFCLVLLANCKPDYTREIQKADNFFIQAREYNKSYDYVKAIDVLEKAIELDSLAGRTSKLQQSFKLISHIKAKIGRFESSLNSSRRALDLLPKDSLAQRAMLLKHQAHIYYLLQDHSRTIKLLEALNPKTNNDKKLLADSYFKTGQFTKAYRVYRDLGQAGDPLIKMQGYHGQMKVFSNPPLTKSFRDSSKALVKRIISLATTLDESALSPYKKCMTYRQAAYALSMVENQKRNGSFFMFKALAQAKLTGESMLERTVAFEANALVVRRASTLEIALNYFKQKNYQKGMVEAYALLGMKESYSPDQRIDYLKKGLNIFRETRFFELPKVMTQTIFNGFYELISLLISQNRYLEAYEISEILKMTEQVNSLNTLDYSILPSRYKAVINELRQSHHTITALQHLMDSTAFLDKEDQKIRRNLLSRQLARHQGTYFSNLSRLREENQNLAELFEPIPITLPTLQSLLPEGVAAADIFYSDGQATVIFIAPQRANVFQATISRDDLDMALDVLKWDFIENPDAEPEKLRQSIHRRKLSNAFVAGLEVELEDIDQLIIFSNLDVPFHLLGRRSYLQENVAISYLTSAKQLQMARIIEPPKYVEFIKPGQTRQIELEFFTNQREKVLLWQDLDRQALAEQKIVLELALSKSTSIADMLQKLAKEKIRLEDISWIGYSAYGF
jgi:hypothetical protein